MAKTVEQLLNIARFTVGLGPGEGFPSELQGGLSILNEAGQYLAVMHTWRWMRRGMQDLGVTADQSYTELPADFLALEAVQSKESLISDLNLVDLKFILELRGNNLGTTSTYHFGALVYENDANGTPKPRLELYPTPETTDADEFQIFYRAKWGYVKKDDDFIPIPDWLEPLYCELVRIYARGLMEEDEGMLHERLAGFSSKDRREPRGEFFRKFVRQDSLANPYTGKPRNGLVTTSKHAYINHLKSFADPPG